MKANEVRWGKVEGMKLLTSNPVLITPTPTFFTDRSHAIHLHYRVRNPLFSKNFNTSLLKTMFYNFVKHYHAAFPEAGWVCTVLGYDGFYFIPESELIGLEIIGYEFS